jgi:hypothetical protein
MPGKRSQPWDEEQNAELREWIRSRTADLGLSQADVTWMLSAVRRTSPKTVESWFRGATVPSFPLLVALVAIFGELPPPLQLALAQAATPRTEDRGGWSRDAAGSSGGSGAAHPRPAM